MYNKSNEIRKDKSKGVINYANVDFPECKFLYQGINLKNDIINYFDLIFCFEFHPFTLTYNIKAHRYYLNYFLNPDF